LDRQLVQADVAIDPLGAEGADAACVPRSTRPWSRIARRPLPSGDRELYVPLAVTLQVCVLPDYLRGHVDAAVSAALGNHRLADGSLGFFHPDRLSFGDDVYAADLIACVQNVEGVQSVTLLDLRRLDTPAGGVPPGVLRLASNEIAQLDNDPDYPEHGKLTLYFGGGR
jgi:hypothetical protein